MLGTFMFGLFCGMFLAIFIAGIAGDFRPEHIKEWVKFFKELRGSDDSV